MVPSQLSPEERSRAAADAARQVRETLRARRRNAGPLEENST